MRWHSGGINRFQTMNVFIVIRTVRESKKNVTQELKTSMALKTPLLGRLSAFTLCQVLPLRDVLTPYFRVRTLPAHKEPLVTSSLWSNT